IEKPEAIENIKEILEISDGIMVARGDLGVEIPIENVPFVQKMLIQEANRAYKPVIVATQMLESMITNPRPTRAEASDVANSILDKADVIMLSGETAVGKYPVETVKIMAQIAKRADATNPTVHTEFGMDGTAKTNPRITIASAVSHAAAHLADELDASAIVTFTESGSTALYMSKYRPETRIIAFTTNEKTCNQLSLLWGVNPFVLEYTEDTSELIRKAEEFMLKHGCINKGEIIVVTAGIPSGKGITNVARVIRVGEKEPWGLCK
ncbi:MAG: pyruvate kinase, partial [Thermoplasmata archaeon]